MPVGVWPAVCAPQMIHPKFVANRTNKATPLCAGVLIRQARMHVQYDFRRTILRYSLIFRYRI